MGGLAAPRVFRNRSTYRLGTADLSGDRPRMVFGVGTYFDGIDRRVRLEDLPRLRAAFALNAVVGVRSIAAIDDQTVPGDDDLAGRLSAGYAELPAERVRTPMPMTAIPYRTGQEARLLRHAMRLSVRAFAWAGRSFPPELHDHPRAHLPQRHQRPRRLRSRRQHLGVVPYLDRARAIRAQG